LRHAPFPIFSQGLSVYLRLHPSTHEIKEINLDKPDEYRITVQGVVPESWLERLGGLRMTVSAKGKTTLEGRLTDQAALNGVLDTLYGLHLPLLEVTCLSEERYRHKKQSKIKKKRDGRV